MPSLRVRIKNQVHKGLLEQKDADRLIQALDHEDQLVMANKREEVRAAKVEKGAYGQLMYRCPNCAVLMAVHYDTRYCECCGQKITFKELEEPSNG